MKNVKVCKTEREKKEQNRIRMKIYQRRKKAYYTSLETTLHAANNYIIYLEKLLTKKTVEYEKLVKETENLKRKTDVLPFLTDISTNSELHELSSDFVDNVLSELHQVSPTLDEESWECIINTLNQYD